MTSDVARRAGAGATTGGPATAGKAGGGPYADRSSGPAGPAGAAVKDRPGEPSFEFEPHNCFACGTLNEHGLRLELHLGERRSWTELSLDPRFEGWVGIAHGGILATILDEVMAWSLVAEDSWGVTARMYVKFRRPTPVGRQIRAEGWIVAIAAPARRHRRGGHRWRRERSRDGRRRLRRGRRGAQARASGALRLPGPRDPGGIRERYARQGGPMTSVTLGGPAHPGRPTGRHDPVGRHRARGRPRRRPEAGGGSARARPRRARRRARCLRCAPDRGLPRSSPTPSTPPGQQRVAPGIGRVYGVRWPLTAAVDRGFRQATRRTGSRRVARGRRPAVPRARARVPLVRVRPPRPARARRPGTRLAAAPARRARGRRLDHRRHARPPGRSRDPPRALPLGGARAARLLARRAGSVGSSARPIATIPFVDRRRGRDPGRRQPRPGPPRRPHRRCRAGRPEGARLGASLADHRRRRRRPRRSWSARPTSPPRPTTATAPGSCATPSPSCRPSRRPRSGPASTAIRRRAGAPSTSRAAATAARFTATVRLGPDAHRDRFPDPAAPSAGDPTSDRRHRRHPSRSASRTRCG